MQLIQRVIIGLVSLMIASAGISGTLSNTKWIAVDDKTNQPRAVVLFTETNGMINGHFVEIYKEPGDSGICSKCPGELKGKPIQDLQFVWGLKQDGENNWTGGRILDPRTGRVYRAKLMLKGDKLYVRGYLGFSLVGRTQVWSRKKMS